VCLGSRIVSGKGQNRTTITFLPSDTYHNSPQLKVAKTQEGECQMRCGRIHAISTTQELFHLLVSTLKIPHFLAIMSKLPYKVSRSIKLYRNGEVVGLVRRIDQ
jgi:hypothetical protein